MDDDLKKLMPAISGKNRNSIKQKLKELKSKGIIKDFTLNNGFIKDENGEIVKKFVESEVIRNNGEKVFGANL